MAHQTGIRAHYGIIHFTQVNRRDAAMHSLPVRKLMQSRKEQHAGEQSEGQGWRAVWQVLRWLTEKFGQDNGFFLASGLAFSLLLYSVPLALLMISALGYTLVDSQQAMEEVQAAIRQFMPRSEQAFAQNIAAIVADRGLLGAAGFITFLVFSTMVFGSIRHVLNIVFQADRGRSLWRGTAHDVLMMAFCIALLVVAMALASFLTIVGSFGEDLPGIGPLVGRGVTVAGELASVMLGGGLVYGLYRFSPARTLRNRSLLIGTVVAIGLFEVAKQAFVWYVAFAESRLPVYGVLGAFVLFFLWLYYASLIFVLGAEVGWAYEQVLMLRKAGSRKVVASGNER
jgi:membrane protein